MCTHAKIHKATSKAKYRHQKEDLRTNTSRGKKSVFQLKHEKDGI